MSRFDAVVIGAGVNGLAAATYMAQRRWRVLVVDRRNMVGGTLSTEEWHPGFRANVARDDPGWIPPVVVKELRLQQFGLRMALAGAGLVAAPADGTAYPLWPDVARTVIEMQEVSRTDAARWRDFAVFAERVGGFLAAAYGVRAPRVQSRAPTDLLALASLGRRVRGYGRRAMMEVLRAVPMPVADLVEEWFETPSLRATLATLGIRDVRHGPMSGGTALVFFHQLVGAPLGHFGVRQVVEGGNGRLADAVAAAARDAGVELRLAADVRRIEVREGRVQAVVLASGEEIQATRVLSSADPRRTFALIEPEWLDPALSLAVDHIRARGATARVHFALDALPAFASGGRAWPREWLAGAITSAPDVAGIERAYDTCKYGELPSEPAMTITIPSVADPSMAPSGRHVMSISVHHVPYDRAGGWTEAALTALGDMAVARLERLAPDFRDRVLQHWVLSPRDLEERFGVTEGSLTQGEIALDQVLFMRPVPACARYATPVRGLWLCGTGTHPALPGGASARLAVREVVAAGDA